MLMHTHHHCYCVPIDDTNLNDTIQACLNYETQRISFTVDGATVHTRLPNSLIGCPLYLHVSSAGSYVNLDSYEYKMNSVASLTPITIVEDETNGHETDFDALRHDGFQLNTDVLDAQELINAAAHVQTEVYAVPTGVHDVYECLESTGTDGIRGDTADDYEGALTHSAWSDVEPTKMQQSYFSEPSSSFGVGSLLAAEALAFVCRIIMS
jgi:hypothetical protein